jgi:hypothetical protein
MFSATPTTYVHGMVSALTLMHWPRASLSGHSVFAMLSLTIIARGADAPSAFVKLRPRMIRVPIVAKCSGETALRLKLPSRPTVSIPAT